MGCARREDKPDIPARFAACIPGIASSNTRPFSRSFIFSGSGVASGLPTFRPKNVAAVTRKISGDGFPFILYCRSSPHTTLPSKQPKTSCRWAVFISKLRQRELVATAIGMLCSFKWCTSLRVPGKRGTVGHRVSCTRFLSRKNSSTSRDISGKNERVWMPASRSATSRRIEINDYKRE